MSEWYYFGCGSVAGHYLFGKGMQKANRNASDRAFEKLERNFDGLLAPRIEPMALYQATLSRLPGLGYAAMAWWDQSVDTRAGSNSIIFAPHPDCDRDWLMEEARRRFPAVFSRLPKPLTWWASEEPGPPR